MCPFHDEKTPSFGVDVKTQLFYCFGCNTGGDLLKFVMLKEGFEFMDAVKLIAEKERIAIPDFRKGAGARDGQLLENAQRYFASNVDKANDYLDKRGIKRKIVEEFGIGYALDDWHALKRGLFKQGFTIEEIARQGLVIRKKDAPNASKNTDDYYDRFRARLMFPINNALGSIVGFAGRAIKDDDLIKYLNSPGETDFGITFYNKKRILYGLDKARNFIRETGEAIVTEGYIDVIAAHQTGIKNVVATCGTAFTKEQANQLSRYSSNLLILMDNDDAGIKAAKNAARVAFGSGLDVRIALTPKGKKDLDELLREEAEGFSRIERYDIIEFYLRTSHSVEKPEDKFKLLRDIASCFSLERDNARKIIWIKEIADRLNVPVEAVEQSYFSRLKEDWLSNNTDIKINAGLDDLPEMYIVNLLTADPEYRKQFFDDIRPDCGLFNNNGLRRVYEVIIEDDRESRQLALPLRHVENGQRDFILEERIKVAFDYIKSKLRERKIKIFPSKLIKILSSQQRIDLDTCASILRKQIADKKVIGLIEKMQEAYGQRDYNSVENITDELNRIYSR